MQALFISQLIYANDFETIRQIANSANHRAGDKTHFHELSCRLVCFQKWSIASEITANESVQCSEKKSVVLDIGMFSKGSQFFKNSKIGKKKNGENIYKKKLFFNTKLYAIFSHSFLHDILLFLVVCINYHVWTIPLNC